MDGRKLKIAEYPEEARLAVRLRWEDRKLLRKLAEERGTTESAILRRALRLYFDALDG